MDYLPTFSFDTLALAIITLAAVREVLVRFWPAVESDTESNGTPAN